MSGPVDHQSIEWRPAVDRRGRDGTFAAPVILVDDSDRQQYSAVVDSNSVVVAGPAAAHDCICPLGKFRCLPHWRSASAFHRPCSRVGDLLHAQSRFFAIAKITSVAEYTITRAVRTMPTYNKQDAKKVTRQS